VGKLKKGSHNDRTISQSRVDGAYGVDKKDSSKRESGNRNGKKRSAEKKIGSMETVGAGAIRHA